MEPITYTNIVVEGVPFTKVLALEIAHAINEHGTAAIVGEMEVDAAREYLNRMDENAAIKITTTAEGQLSVLFYGLLTNVGVEQEAEYATLTLTAATTSALLDIQPVNRSYQKTSATYGQVMEAALNGAGAVNMKVTDKATGKMLVQCNETNWAFCMRLASMLNAPIFSEIDAVKPQITVGLPGRGKVVDLSKSETKSTKETVRVGTSIQTRQYMYLGSEISYYGIHQKVKALSCTMEKGVLLTTIEIAAEEKFVQQPIVNQQVSGKMYSGTVMAVQADKVQVHITDIDSSYDAGGDVWLPYSTAYSSGDGSGFYCMPAVGDTVRVFFPGTDEGSAFAASSVCVSPGAKVTDKQWRGPNGKQILLTEEGIYITTNADDSKIFINLTDESEITISSNKDISVCAKNNLSLMSNNNISITAEKDILISTAESYIDMTPDGIEMGASNIVIK